MHSSRVGNAVAQAIGGVGIATTMLRAGWKSKAEARRYVGNVSTERERVRWGLRLGLVRKWRTRERICWLLLIRNLMLLRWQNRRRYSKEGGERRKNINRRVAYTHLWLQGYMYYVIHTTHRVWVRYSILPPGRQENKCLCDETTKKNINAIEQVWGGRHSGGRRPHSITSNYKDTAAETS